MNALEYFRLLNIFIAGMALIINSTKAVRMKFFTYMNFDAMMGFQALMAWCLCYSIAASIATTQNVRTGIWTIIMGLPCWWTFAAGVTGWNNNMSSSDLRHLKRGALSPNEIRHRNRRR